MKCMKKYMRRLRLLRSVVRNKKAPENLINKEVLGRARFERRIL